MSAKIHKGPVSATIILRFEDGQQITFDINEGHWIESRIALNRVEQDDFELRELGRVAFQRHHLEATIKAEANMSSPNPFVTRTHDTWVKEPS